MLRYYGYATKTVSQRTLTFSLHNQVTETCYTVLTHTNIIKLSNLLFLFSWLNFGSVRPKWFMQWSLKKNHIKFQRGSKLPGTPLIVHDGKLWKWFIDSKYWSVFPNLTQSTSTHFEIITFLCSLLYMKRFFNYVSIQKRTNEA